MGCRLRISTAKAWQLIRRGKIRSLKIDTSRRVTPQTLADYIAELEAASSAGAA